MLPHPIGEADESRIAQKGIEAAAECVRLAYDACRSSVSAEYAN
jgi:hypothetical protein